MQLFFTIICIRITTLTWIFHDHPLVEYPLSGGKDVKGPSEQIFIFVFDVIYVIA